MSNLYELNQSEFDQLANIATHRYGPLFPGYLARSLAVVDGMLERYPRVCAMRVDLRFAVTHHPDDPDTPNCFQRTDPTVITRFMESLKSQLREEHRREGRRGEPTLPGYIWVRERDHGTLPHYHLVLLFNKDVYAFLGNYLDPDANNMATRIQKAWCSALDLAYPDHKSLSHFPRRGVYVFDRQHVLNRDDRYTDFLIRIAYFAKQDTKDIADGYRNFGCSQS